MKNFKQQFLEMRNNTPKRVQWLLLAAAFVVVLILLTLLLSGGDNDDVIESDNLQVALKADPDMITWTDVIVGQTKSQVIKVSVNAPVRITAVNRQAEIDGLKVNSTCKNAGVIKASQACTITVTYAPTAPMQTETTKILIDWHADSETDTMKKVKEVILTLGAQTPVIVEEPKPVVISEPEPEPVYEEEEEEEPLPVKEEIKQEIEAIAPSAPMPYEDEEEEIAVISRPEACSDFAFPGYNSSGIQIGWIKPEGGAYYFHPFEDKECNEPTGIYNPDSGIITDIDGNGKKIGTDADHIGYTTIEAGALPQLSVSPRRATNTDTSMYDNYLINGMSKVELEPAPPSEIVYGTSGTYVDSTQPYDRTFVLRQYKPIPATIVSDVRADYKILSEGKSLPVRATVDRNVYSDNGRTIILPAGTLMLGYVIGEIPGPYKAIGRMEIQWYQFIRPDGVEFNFKERENDPFSADAQGRVGVPGRGSTDYMEQFLMPMLTAFVPAAVNLINPVADAFVNQIDLDNNTVVQSGTMRSSELAKNEIITAWNQVAQKLMVDMLDNTVPPFTIAAGTRITVYSPQDLRVVCTDETKACAVQTTAVQTKSSTGEPRRDWLGKHPVSRNEEDPSWVGQARSFVTDAYCVRGDDGLLTAKPECATSPELCGGYAYSTLLLWCKSLNYESKKDLQYKAYTEDQKAQYQQKIEDLGGVGSQQFNEEILGIKYNDDGTIQNPYASAPSVQEDVITCEDGSPPDEYGCCAGEIYTDMGEDGFNCCPESGGDCFPPII